MLKDLFRKIKYRLFRLPIPRWYVVILFLMLFCALIIRLSTGGTHVVYNALGHRGIFPGPFLYCISYVLRIALFSVALGFCMYVCRTYREGAVPLILNLITSALLLLEYKLIFGGVSLILAMLFCILSGFFCVISVILLKVKSRGVSACALAFALLQFIFFIQLISLSVCI